jgi:predicted HAD superfamily Cof-like phosphohydrolase
MDKKLIFQLFKKMFTYVIMDKLITDIQTSVTTVTTRVTDWIQHGFIQINTWYSLQMQPKTNYQKVKEFHQTFEMAIAEKCNASVFDDKKLVQLRLELIDEEVEELKQAINDKNMKEVADAFTDILYVVYGAGVSFGIDLDKSFDLVHKSNMSKVCDTEEIAKKTVQWYKENEQRYDSPVYKKTGDKFMVYNESTGKTLKSINYVPVDLTSLCV